MYLYILIYTDIYLCRYVYGQIDRQTDKHLDRQIYTLRAVGGPCGKAKVELQKACGVVLGVGFRILGV